MPKPTMLAVDDDPEVLASISRDLRSRYGGDYRIMRATSGQQALEVLAELALRARPVRHGAFRTSGCRGCPGSRC